MKTGKIISVIAIIVGLTLAATAAPQDGRGRQRSPGAPQDGPRGGQFAPGPQGPDGNFDRPMPQGPGQPPMEPPMGGVDMGRFVQMLTRALELTPEQEEAIRQIVEEHRDAAQAQRETIRQTSIELRKAVMEGDPEAAEKLAETLADAMIDQAVGQAETMKAVKAQLTEEQLQKLDAIKTQMRERFEQRRPGDGQGQFAPQPPRGEFGDEQSPPQRPRQRRQPRPNTAD